MNCFGRCDKGRSLHLSAFRCRFRDRAPAHVWQFWGGKTEWKQEMEQIICFVAPKEEHRLWCFRMQLAPFDWHNDGASMKSHRTRFFRDSLCSAQMASRIDQQVDVSCRYQFIVARHIWNLIVIAWMKFRTFRIFFHGFKERSVRLTLAGHQDRWHFEFHYREAKNAWRRPFIWILIVERVGLVSKKVTWKKVENHGAGDITRIGHLPQNHLRLGW